jgi:hypothetical protein
MVMIERELNPEETKAIYALINERRIEPFSENIERKYGELYYDVDGTQYRLIFDQNFDYFSDIAYEGVYDTNS